MVRSFGQDWIRRAKAAVARQARERLPQSLKDKVPTFLLKQGLSAAAADKGRVQLLDDKLWGGYPDHAYDELSKLARDLNAAPGVRTDAVLSLAAWHGARAEYARALAFLQESFSPREARNERRLFLEAQYLCLTGRGGEARDLIDAHGLRSFGASHHLVMANSWNSSLGPQGDPAAPERMLEEINAIYRLAGLLPIGLRDPTAPVSLDNLACENVVPVDDPANAVSVIVPLYNGEATIETALSSIAAQSWRALDVIIVDDCSTDLGCERVEAFCRRDSRFRLLRKRENGGSYMARNTGLEHVATPFVTVHDADDWSHPQKLELQMRALLNAAGPYSYTMLARCSSELAFIGGTRAVPRLVRENFSSGLFRTEALRRAGGWDHARVSADSELFWRMEALHGGSALTVRTRRVLPDCPLSFARQAPGSLTQAGATSLTTLHHGVRREYREAAAFWHLTLKPGDSLEKGGPFFPAPALIRPGTSIPPAHDLFLIADFNAGGFDGYFAFSLLRAAAALPLDSAILHYPSYESDVARPLSFKVRGFCRDHAIRIVAPGEVVTAQLALVADGSLLRHRMDRFMKIDAPHRLALASDGETPDPSAIANAAAMLGADVRHVPVGTGNGAFRPPLLVPASGPGSASRTAPQRPVVGALAPGIGAGWKNDVFEQMADAGFEMRLYAADDTPAPSRRLPRRWKTVPAAVEPTAFFGQIDIFVHFPEAQSLNGHHLALLSALAAGVPVVTTRALGEMFGSTVIGCEAGAAADMAGRVLADPALRERMSQGGREFVARNHDLDAFRRFVAGFSIEPRAARNVI